MEIRLGKETEAVIVTIKGKIDSDFNIFETREDVLEHFNLWR